MYALVLITIRAQLPRIKSEIFYRFIYMRLKVSYDTISVWIFRNIKRVLYNKNEIHVFHNFAITVGPTKLIIIC